MNIAWIKAIFAFLKAPPDKTVHFVLYFIFAFLFLSGIIRAHPENNTRWLYIGLITIAVTSLYGATDEFHQYFVPGRTLDFFDWLTDTIAAMVCVIVVQGFRFTRYRYLLKAQ